MSNNTDASAKKAEATETKKEDSIPETEKPEPETGKPEKPDYYSFLSNYGYSIIFTICLGVITIGSVGLYTTKVAMAGNLPTALTETNEMYTKIPSNTFHKFVPVHDTSPGIQGNATVQAAHFSSEKFASMFENGIFCEVNKQSSKSNFGLYLSSVINYIASMNNFITTSAYGWIGNTIPESVIMLLYPILVTFICPLMYIFNLGLSFFAHAKYIPQYFRQKISGGKWEPEKDISYLHLTNLLLFGFLWWWVSIISALVVAPCMSLYSVISPLFATYDIYNKNEKDPQNFASFLKNTFFYKKNLILLLSMLSLAYNASTYLGNNFLIGVIVAILVAVFGLGIFKQPIPAKFQFTPPTPVDKVMLPAALYHLCKSN